MPDFRILGPLEVVDGGGAPLPLGGTKQRAVLAVLLLRAGEVVSTDFLTAALWGDSAPRTANTSLQNLISSLRKLLGPELLVTRPPGYRLEVDKERVDLYRFEQLVQEAAGREPEERVRTLREALGLWRGEPLAELAFEPFAQTEVFRLEELRLAATEDLNDAELACGATAELVPRLESLVARNPLRERLRGQLMLALYRAGRQADALAAYQDLRRALVDELGLDPGPQLQALHASILRQEAGLSPAAAEASPEEQVEQVAAVLTARPARRGAGDERGGPRRAARGPVRVSVRRGGRSGPRRAVRRADEGVRPALRRAARDARRRRGADAGAPILRAAAPVAAGARRSAHAARDDELRPRARAGVPRRGGGVRRRLVHRVGPEPRPVLPRRARRHRVHRRHAEHVRDRALARAPHRHPQAARRHRPDADA